MGAKLYFGDWKRLFTHPQAPFNSNSCEFNAEIYFLKTINEKQFSLPFLIVDIKV
jgi:hypothetical protein